MEEQSELIEQSGLAETRGSSSGLPGFLGEITIGGSVAASYLYNLNDPNDADRDGLGYDNSGLNNRLYPLHPDHNSFALDAVWFEIEREVSELGGIKSLYSDSYFSRAQFDVAYGGDAYRRLKSRYDPAGRLGDLYAKCVLKH